jgi:hypothetical protein
MKKNKVNLYTKRDSLFAILESKETGEWVASDRNIQIGQTIQIFGMTEKFGYLRGSSLLGIIADVYEKSVKGKLKKVFKLEDLKFIASSNPNLRFPRNPLQYEW